MDELNTPVDAMTHHVFHVAGVDAKKELVRRLASGTGRRILFMRTKHHARKLAKQLNQSGIPSVDLHGNLSQPARDRNLAAFAAGTARVLVATDIAARGVHVDVITGGPRGSAQRTQGISSSFQAHGAGRERRRRSHCRTTRAAQGHPGVAAEGRHPCHPATGGRRFARRACAGW